jgi:tetratricopeptide (TPR) repeat protein
MEECRKLFLDGRYEECLHILSASPSSSSSSSTSSSSSFNSSLDFNIALCAFLASQQGQNDVSKLLDELERVVEMAVEKEKRSEEEEEHESLHCATVFEHSVVFFHCACVFFRLSKYTKAMWILQDLFLHRAGMEEAIRQPVCALLLDACVVIPSRSLGDDVVKYLDEKIPLASQSERCLISKAKFYLFFHEISLAQEALSTLLSRKSFCTTNPFHETIVRCCLEASCGDTHNAYHRLEECFIPSNQAGQPSPSPSTPPVTHFRESPFAPLNLENSHSRRMFYNAMGCVSFQRKSFYLASLYFYFALLENDAIVCPPPTRALAVLCAEDQRQSILRNLGVSLLFAHTPALAFRTLRSVLPTSSHDPSLWLRMGECVVSHHVLSSRSHTGAPVKITIQTLNGRDHLLVQGTESASQISSEVNSEEMGLDDGLACFQNCLSLCERSESLSPREYLLMLHAYQNMAFLLLELRRYSAAISIYKAGFKKIPPFDSKEIEDIQMRLCLYASEASLLLGRADLADTFLQNTLPSPSLAVSLHGNYLINLAVTLAAKQNYDQALEAAEMAGKIANDRAFLLKILILLKKGDTENALKILSEQRRDHRPTWLRNT